jgi:recombination protein RecA
MALPAKLLEQIKSAGHACQVGLPEASDPDALPFGFAALDAWLPDHGLARGAVVELSAQERASHATSLALMACRSAQGVSLSSEMPWCAFVDPTGSLHAPGVLAAGVALDRLLVVRPSAEALARTAIRLVESHAFSVVVVDTAGAPGTASPLLHSHAAWPRVVRRIALALGGSRQCVLLITDPSLPRSVPWPVAERLELNRPNDSELVVRIAKDKRGRVSPPHRLVWSAAPPLARTHPSSVPPPPHARLTA